VIWFRIHWGDAISWWKHIIINWNCFKVLFYIIDFYNNIKETPYFTSVELGYKK
jgi:hypothetical protein